MIKVIVLIKKRDDMTQEEFARYWEEQHGPLVRRVFPGVERYVQVHLTGPPRGDGPQFDGVAEVWYKDQQAWRAGVEFYMSDDGKVIRDDERKFIDVSKMIVLVGEEKVIKP